MRISIQVEDFDVARETKALRESSAAIGAVVTFIGLVRDINDGAGVTSLELEHYPDMAEREIERIATEAGSHWPLEAIHVVHRVGKLKPMDNIVFVGVASQHRGDAFRACEFIMDNLKTRAPFWKKEHRVDSDGNIKENWINARQSDQDKHAAWK